MGFAKYWEAGKISLNTRFSYGIELGAFALLKGVYIFIFISLWKVVYAHESSIIEGFTLSMMIWYLVMTESIVTSLGKIVEKIGDKVQSGEITNSLTKPYNFIFFEYASTMGGFDVPWQALPLIAIIIVLALTLHFLIMALLAIFSFWLEDTKSLNFVYDKIVFILGGMLAPLEIFPTWLEQITKYLPFSYIAYYPAKLWVQFSLHNFWSVVLGEIIWIIITIIALAIAYRICIKNISINGG